MTEFQIYTAIVEDIARRFPDGGKEKADRFLMQPSKDSFVQVNGVDDHTRNTMMRGKDFDLEQHRIKGQ